MLTEGSGLRCGFWAPPKKGSREPRLVQCLSFPMCPRGGVSERVPPRRRGGCALGSLPAGPRPRGCPEKVPRSQCCVQPPRDLGDAGYPCSRPGPWAQLPSGLPARLPRALQEAAGEPEHPPAAALHLGPSAVVRRDRASQGSSEPPGWRWEGQSQGQWEPGWRVRA